MEAQKKEKKDESIRSKTCWIYPDCRRVFLVDVQETLCMAQILDARFSWVAVAG